MRRAVKVTSVLGLLWVWSCAHVAVAQDEKPGAAGQQAGNREGLAPSAGDQDENKAGERPDRKRRPRYQPTLAGKKPRLFARRVERLHEAVKKELSLGQDQEEAVDGLFEEYLASLSQGPNRRGPALAPDQKEKWKQLREEAKKARAAGDRAALDRIRNEIRGSLSDWSQEEAVSGDQFVERVAKELNEKQASKFRRLAQRFRVGTATDSPSEALRRIHYAATRRAEVDLSKEQRRLIVHLIREAQDKLEKIEDDEKAADKVVEDTYAAVAKILSAKQRERFENALRQVELEQGLRRPEAAVQTHEHDKHEPEQKPEGGEEPDSAGKGEGDRGGAGDRHTDDDGG